MGPALDFDTGMDVGSEIFEEFFEFGGAAEFGALGMLASVLLIYLLILGVAVAQYVMTALSLQSIARHRGISNAWVAWIPIGDAWVLGSIADKFDEKAQNVSRKWRVILLLFPIIGVLLGFYFFFNFIGSIASLAAGVMIEEMLLTSLLNVWSSFFFISFLASIVASAETFCRAVCLFKLFDSVDAKKAVTYFLISLLVPFGQPICLMICRSKVLKNEPPTDIPLPNTSTSSAPQ